VHTSACASLSVGFSRKENWLALCRLNSLLKLKLKSRYDWRSVRMSWYRAPLWDLRPDITSCRNVAVWNLRSCICGAPSLTRGRVCRDYTSQETRCVTATEPNRLMLFRETVVVYCENHTEHANTLCGQNAEFYYVKAGGRFSNHSALLCLRQMKTAVDLQCVTRSS
jgi:hypothetical protein